MRRRELFSNAVRETLPIFFGYIPLGMAFGFMLSSAGYGAVVAGAMSLFMYGGSSQYLAVEMFASGTALYNMFLMVFFLSIRHMVYGLSLIEKFQGAGKYKPYLIYALTDEAYALFVAARLPEGKDRAPYMFLLSALCHGYWIAGTLIGSLLGGIVRFNTTGMDFVLTALFIVLTINLFAAYKTILPFAIGAGAGFLALLPGNDNLMMPIAIFLILFVLLIFRRPIEARLDRARGGEVEA